MGSTVTVACKIPGGLNLRLFTMVSQPEPVPGGGFRDTLIARPVGASVLIKGGVAPAGMNPTSGAQLEYGFALTPGVDADFFEEWLKQNEDHDAVRNHLIFAHVQKASVTAEARDYESVRSGLEPLDQKNDPRRPRGNGKVSDVAPASEAVK